MIGSRLSTAALAVALVALPALPALGQAPTPHVGLSEQKLVPDEIGEFSRFGEAIALDDDRAAIGLQPEDGIGGVAVYAAAGGSDGWTQTAWLDPPTSLDDDAPEVGTDVDLDGDTLVAGAEGVDTADKFEAGAALVFEHTDDGWEHVQTLTPPDPTALNRYGGAVAVDGDTIAVSEPENELAGEYERNGLVHVYEEQSGTYVHQETIAPPADDDRERLGVDLDLEDGTLVAGAPQDETPNGSGAAYVYEDTGDGWTQQARLTAPEADGARILGQSVDLDGDAVIAGAPGPQFAICCPTPPSPPGQAHVFEEGDEGWEHAARLEPVTSSRGSSLGMGVALDGDLAFAGAPDAPRDTRTGVVSVFERTDLGWTEAGRALSGDPASGDAFGDRLAANGGSLFSAETGDDEAGHQAGAVHVVDDVLSGLASP